MPSRDRVKLDTTITVELTDGPHVVLLVGDGFPVEQLKRPPSPIGHSIGKNATLNQRQGESVFKSAREEKRDREETKLKAAPMERRPVVSD